jgi:hypothetical protein
MGHRQPRSEVVGTPDVGSPALLANFCGGGPQRRRLAKPKTQPTRPSANSPPACGEGGI